MVLVVDYDPTSEALFLTPSSFRRELRRQQRFRVGTFLRFRQPTRLRASPAPSQSLILILSGHQHALDDRPSKCFPGIPMKWRPDVPFIRITQHRLRRFPQPNQGDRKRPANRPCDQADRLHPAKGRNRHPGLNGQAAMAESSQLG